MDIDLLSKMVKELILDNDRVVLPGLGCFVAEIVPSTFSDKGYTINPPYRKLYFRAKPDDDYALAAFYADFNDVPMEVADRVINDFVAELKAILFERKTVVFPGLGRLRATKENTVFFVADEDLDIYPEGFGLEPVSMKTHEETKEEVAAVVKELKAVVDDVPVEENVPVIDESSVEIEIPTVEDMLEEEPVAPKKKRSFWRCLGKTILWLILIAALLLVAFVAVSRYSPDITDKILYTPEELEILDSDR